MENLIAVEDLIKSAKKNGIDLGKGNPYNRLRYYTKIGWLPHMIRKKGDKKGTRGHYPEWALERLELIEKLKEEGYSNEEIAKKINLKNKTRGVSSFLETPEARTRLLSYVSLALIVLILLAETGIVSVGRTKNKQILENIQTFPRQVLDAGGAYIKTDSKNVFVRSSTVGPNSKIHVSFNDDYSPASRFWISERKVFEGFMLELDAPVAQNAEFSWWITD